MLTRPLHHIRQNLVAYLALFVALGGTSYATLVLPAGSVGNRQIRNHSITPVKLDPRTIAGSIKAWASLQLTNHGIVAAASSGQVGVLYPQRRRGHFLDAAAIQSQLRPCGDAADHDWWGPSGLRDHTAIHPGRN